MGARTLQPPRLADVGGLVEARLQFHQRGHRLAVLGRLAKRFHDGRVARGAVERLLDRHHVGIERRLAQEAHHHVEGLVGVVQQHVLLLDRLEHVAFVVLHPFGHPRGEAGPQEVRAVVEHQLLEVGHADHPVELDHLVLADQQLTHDDAAQLLGRAGGDRQPHHLAAAAPLERHLELAHQIFGLFLDLDIAVAQHAEAEVVLHPVAREEAFDVQQQHVLEEDEALRALACGQVDETGDLMRDRQQRLPGPAVALALEFEREAVAHVGDEGEGVRRVDGQRREHREDLLEKLSLQELEVLRLQIFAHHEADARRFQLELQGSEHPLLLRHELARVLVDQHQLLGRGQPVRRRCGVARMGQLAQAGDAHCVELVEVGRRDRQEAQPLEQRHLGVLGLFQHPPVEAKPAELAVEEAAGARQVGVGQILGRGDRGFEKIGDGHGGHMRHKLQQLDERARMTDRRGLRKLL